VSIDYYAVNDSKKEIFELGKLGRSIDDWPEEAKTRFIKWMIECNWNVRFVNDATGDLIPYQHYALIGSTFGNINFHKEGRPLIEEK